MKKIKLILVALLLTTFSTNFVSAGTIGVTYSKASIDGSGTEYVIDGVTRNKNTGTSSKDVDIGSIFLETNTLDGGVRLGFEWIPEGAEFVNKTSTQTNITSATSATESKTQVVKGEFKNHMTLYLEKDIFNKVYIKGGLTSVSIKSLESIGTGSQYPDDEIFGYVAGVGYRHQLDNGIVLKAEYAYNDYETIKLNSTNTSNEAEGTIDSISGRISVGYNF